MSRLRDLVQRVLASGGYRLNNLVAWRELVDNHARLERELRLATKAATCLQLAVEGVVEAGIIDQYLASSQSQFGQDFFALWELGFKRDGYFVEFGATDGVALSNTYLLEKHFGWRGILAEPAVCWHEALKHSRSARIDTCCVWPTSGETLAFAEVGELSTAASLIDSDEYSAMRENGKTEYFVKTLSLVDLLRKYDAPRTIDFLSIDTEGSELQILRAFPFSEYRFSVICCEHNFTSNREPIHELLTSNGYRRKWERLSGVDDWYVNDGSR